MRLHPLVIQIIAEKTKEFFGNNACVWLFGSRVDDTKLGGDIDIYIETDLLQVMDSKYKLLSELCEIVGDRKIDIVTHKRHTPIKPIGKIAKETGIEITNFKRNFSPS